MPDRRDRETRLQRLADLSIEIRMLKARAHSALEEHTQNLGAASCPHCGHSAGLAQLPREYRRPSTLVRCFSCHRDAAALDWVTAGAKRVLDTPHGATR